MTITEVAELVWRHSHTASFGKTENWSDKLFTKSWGELLHPQLNWRGYGAGWYWFLVNMNLEELHAVQRPISLPMKGCDIGALVQANVETFGTRLLCATQKNGRVVIYNGHEGSICDRVRAHFSLNNHRTGALGLKHFLLHSRSWEVRFFAAPCLPSLPKAEQDRVQLLMNSKSGRCAVESAWRSVYGWPVLCKE